MLMFKSYSIYYKIKCLNFVLISKNFKNFLFYRSTLKISQVLLLSSNFIELEIHKIFRYLKDNYI